MIVITILLGAIVIVLWCITVAQRDYIQTLRRLIDADRKLIKAQDELIASKGRVINALERYGAGGADGDS